jgi:hypothetical protein
VDILDLQKSKRSGQLVKQRLHIHLFNHLFHLFPGWALLKAGRRLQKLGQLRQIADSVSIGIEN